MIEDEKLQKYAREYLIAKERYSRAIAVNVRSSPIMTDKTVFWRIIEDLREIVKINQTSSRVDPVRKSVYELFRQLCNAPKEYYGLEDMPSFIATYEKLKSSLAKTLQKNDFLGERFFDVVDSLPLTGKLSCLAILAGEATDYASLTKIVGDGVFTGVISKDNMVAQCLEEVYSDVVADHYATQGDDAKEFCLELENADP